MIDVDAAVLLTAERIQGAHPEWRAPQVALETMRAITGQGAYSDWYRTLREAEE